MCLQEAQDIPRPYTAGTADSGCQEDAGSVVLSPNTDRNKGDIESVVVDVTDHSNNNSLGSGPSSVIFFQHFIAYVIRVHHNQQKLRVICLLVEARSNREEPLVIRHLSSFSNNEAETLSASTQRFNGNDHFRKDLKLLCSSCTYVERKTHYGKPASAFLHSFGISNHELNFAA